MKSSQVKFAQSSFVYFNYSIQEAIRRLHKLGYDGIEIWGGRPHMYRHDLDDQLDEIAALLDELEMVVPNFIPAQFRYPSVLCSFNETVRQDSVGYVKDAIENALRVKSPYVSLCPGMTLFGQDLDQGWAQLKKSFLELLDYVENKEVTLLIEPAHEAETTLILTIEQGLRMIDEIDSEKLGILLDTGHCNVNGEDVPPVIASLKDTPLHIHIDDNFGDSDAHLIPGEGNINFDQLAVALKEIDYQGFISAELGFQYCLDPDSAVKQTLTVLSEKFR
jgi:protein FrlC